MKFLITKVEVELNNVDFAEWANAVEEQSPDDIERWNEAYHKEVEEKLKRVFPSAEVVIVAGYDGSGDRYLIGYKKVDDGPCDYDLSPALIDSWAKSDVENVVGVVNSNGAFWNA